MRPVAAGEDGMVEIHWREEEVLNNNRLKDRDMHEIHWREEEVLNNNRIKDRDMQDLCRGEGKKNISQHVMKV